LNARYRWVVLSVGAGSQAALAASAYGLSAIGPAIQARYRLDLVQTGAALTAIMLGMALTNLLWGFATDRFGERRTLLVGLGGATAAMLAASAGSGYVRLLVALGLTGMLGCVAVTAGGRSIMAWFDPRERGLALGIRQMMVPLGGGMGAIGLPILLIRFGLAACFVALGLCLGAATISAIWMRRAPRVSRVAPTPGPSPLRDPRIWRVASAGGLMMAGQMSLLTYLTTFLTHHRGLELTPAATLLAVLEGIGALGLVAVGRLSDRLGQRIGLLRVLALVSSVGLLVIGLSVDRPLGYLIPLILGVGIVSVTSNVLNFTATGEIAGRARAGTALGLQATLFAITSVAAPLCFAALVAARGWGSGYLFAGALGLVAWWLLRPLVFQERVGWVQVATPASRPGALQE